MIGMRCVVRSQKRSGESCECIVISFGVLVTLFAKGRRRGQKRRDYRVLAP
jgi:hypothetical protein